MSEIFSFGEWVQKRRNQLGYSRTVLAKQIGCAPITVKKIERDERRPSEEMAELFAHHLQIPEESKDDFIRRARGEFVARFGSPEEMSLAEAQDLASAQEGKPNHNLPVQTTSFFGRKSELAEIAERLADPNCKLLTILGAGGMGKTRLAIEAATGQIGNFTDGIVYVSLAPIEMAHSDQTLNPLVGALADVLKISFHAKGTPEEQMLTYLSRKEVLLVLDNFEHLIDTADYVADLIQAAPDLKILVTSRTRLHLQEEWVLSLHGLHYSKNEDQDEMQSDAVRLFTQRAKQLKSSFNIDAEEQNVLRICRLVDGMPLGLELAAAWVGQLSCEAVAEEIEAEIDFLSTNLRNVPDRHRSIRAVFSYSWQHLSEKEQAVLQKLSVFRGGFERDAAKAVAGASLHLLSGLVDKSLLSVTESGRYFIHELLRQFGAEKLSPTAGHDLHTTHCDFYLRFLSEQEPHIKEDAAKRAISAIKSEIDNVRIAWQWGLEQGQHAYFRPAAMAFFYFFDALGWGPEGEEMFRKAVTTFALQKATSQVDDQTLMNTRLLARARGSLSFFQMRLEKLDDAIETALAGLNLLKSAGASETWDYAWCQSILASSFMFHNKEKQAIAIWEEASHLFYKFGDYV